jgi:hypothetical protein
MLHVESKPLADLHPAARADQKQADLMTVFQARLTRRT